jgi:hypothetical protein
LLEGALHVGNVVEPVDRSRIAAIEWMVMAVPVATVDVFDGDPTVRP